jgi:hypothetical protein
LRAICTELEQPIAPDGNLDGSPDNQRRSMADFRNYVSAKIPHEQLSAISVNRTRSNLKSAAMNHSTG